MCLKVLINYCKKGSSEFTPTQAGVHGGGEWPGTHLDPSLYICNVLVK